MRLNIMSNCNLYNIIILTTTLSILIIICNAHSGINFRKEKSFAKKTHVFVEHAHVIKKRSFDQDIRIEYYYTPEVDLLTPARKAKLKNDLIPAVMNYFRSLLKVRPIMVNISLDRDCEGGTYPDTLPGYVTCAGPCSSISTCGPITIPEQHLKRCHYCDTNGNNCKFDPSTPTDGGVSGIDYLLYVTSQITNVCDEDTLAYASSCLQESALDRPIVGYINICEAGLDPGSLETMIATAIHETMHAFGFSKKLFAYFHDSAGNPRTARDKKGVPLDNKAGASTITTTNYVWSTANGDVMHEVTIVVTPEVVNAVREHYACDTLLGAELENQGGLETVGDHWEQRTFGNEGMVGVRENDIARPTFSNITLALLQDSGWYEVNFSMAEPLHWGRGLGCDFVTRSCLGWSNTKAPASARPFCFEFNKNINYCNDDYSAYGNCDIHNYKSTPIDPDYQYFNTDPGLNAASASEVGGFICTADFCPTYGAGTNQFCSVNSSQPTTANNIALETFGVNSRCFEQPGAWTDGATVASKYGAGCYQYRCIGGDVLITVANNVYNCTANATDSVISITNLQVNGRSYTGRITCPPCEEICWDKLFDCMPMSCCKYNTENMLLISILLFAMLFY